MSPPASQTGDRSGRRRRDLRPIEAVLTDYLDELRAEQRSAVTQTRMSRHVRYDGLWKIGTPGEQLELDIREAA